MKIRFCGAAEGVTGSCYLVETDRYRFLLDCGMFQGDIQSERRSGLPFPFNPEEIDFVILSHAHLDHCGRLPLLVSRGFRSEIFCTEGTADLTDIVLRDSAYIHLTEIDYRNRKNKRRGRSGTQPLYSLNDAIEATKYLTPVFCGIKKELRDGITMRLSKSGHMPGASITELWIRETDENGQEKTTKLVYSGDLGTGKYYLRKRPELVQEADILIMECEYGDQEHPKINKGLEALKEDVLRTIRRGGTVVMPAAAVGRTQELLYCFHKLMKEDSEFSEAMRGIKVYVDSPMGLSATEIYRRHLQLELDGIVMDDPLDFPGRVIVRDVFDSRQLNYESAPKVIIAASGMCEEGRIKHHLRHNLWNPNSSVLFTGYQAEETLGRAIVDGIKEVRIFGEPIHVSAEICKIKGFSNHADREELLEWLSGFDRLPEHMYLVHSERNVKQYFKVLIRNKMNIEAELITSECTVDFGRNGELTGIRPDKEQELYENLLHLRKRLSDVHHEIDRLLYTTTLLPDENMSDERVKNIDASLEILELGMSSLTSAVDESGQS